VLVAGKEPACLPPLKQEGLSGLAFGMKPTRVKVMVPTSLRDMGHPFSWPVEKKQVPFASFRAGSSTPLPSVASLRMTSLRFVAEMKQHGMLGRL
jgi:hypothetical protein